MKKYIVVSDIDYEELQSFNTKKEAKDFIKETMKFDKENGNPFNETYHIEVEEENENE